MVGIVQGLKERDVTFPVEPMSFPTSAAKHCTSRNSNSATAIEYQGELVLGTTAPSVSESKASRHQPPQASKQGRAGAQANLVENG